MNRARTAEIGKFIFATAADKAALANYVGTAAALSFVCHAAMLVQRLAVEDRMPDQVIPASQGAAQLCCTKPLKFEVPLSPDGFSPRPL